jgi:hypothetical protein
MRWTTPELLALPLLLLVSLPLPGIGPAAAQSQGGQAPAVAAEDAPPLEPAAMDTLKRMGDLLKSAKSFTFTYRTVREQQAQTGKMVDFLHLTRVALVRPNKLRLDVTGEVWNTILTYDGKVVTMLDPTQKFSTQLDAPPSIDETLVLLMDKFQTSFPVMGALLADPYEKMKDGLKTAVDLGVTKVDGVDCRHLLFGEDDADWQLWVEAGPRPLPRRLAVVYKNAPGAPRVVCGLLGLEAESQHSRRSVRLRQAARGDTSGAEAGHSGQVNPRTGERPWGRDSRSWR